MKFIFFYYLSKFDPEAPWAIWPPGATVWPYLKWMYLVLIIIFLHEPMHVSVHALDSFIVASTL